MKFQIDNLQKQIEKWLITGAFLRVSQDEILLYGFSNENDLEQNNNVLTVSYANFFDFQSVQKKNFPVSRMKITEFLQVLENFIVYKHLNSKNAEKKISWLEPEFSQFEKSYQLIQEKITAGELNKAVPIVFAESKMAMSAELLISMLEKVLSIPTSAWPYGLWDLQGGVIGATPEILFAKSGTQIKTMALAGTLPKSSGLDPQTLLQDPKERGEHQWVIDDLVTNLKKIGEVIVGPTQLLELPNLYHLKTDLIVQRVAGTTEVSVQDLIKSLHPTPALGVSPRAAGLDWFKTLPFQAERGIFGAPICFEISEHESICLVAIRNLIWSEQQLRIYTGCGIVASSQLQKEWIELQNKQQAVRLNLGLASA